MPTRSFELTQELDAFVAAKVESGLFRDSSGVVRAALRLLGQEVEAHEAKVEALGEALDDTGAASLAEGNIFNDVRQELGLPSRAAVV